MGFKAILAAGGFMLASVVPASAQATIDGNSIDEILNIARGYGSATLEQEDGKDPSISGKIEGVSYYLFFRNCNDSHTNCEDLNFYAGFLDNKQTLDAINAWNRDKRFGKAYLDGDLDAVIEYDVNVQYGVSAKTLDSDYSLWSQILKQFAEYIGFQ